MRLNGCSSECQALGLTGYAYSVQWFGQVTQPHIDDAEYGAMDMRHNLEDML